MKKQFQQPVLALVLFSIVLSSCVNLKSVNHFSSTSSKGIQKFEDIGYSFRQHCMDRCLFEAIRKFEIQRELDCNCDDYKKADRATLLIYHSIKGYFDGLTNLSDNALTSYHLDAINSALTEGTYGDVKIEKEHVEAYSKMSKILLKAATDIYRKNKIKKYVAESNEPIQILLDKFQFILQKNLEGELDFKKEKFYAYFQDIKMNNALTEYEKGQAAVDYYQQLSGINAKQAQIDAFARSLKSISEGHQKLYDNINKMSTKELKELLMGYTSDIGDIISEFNKLQN